MQWTGLCLTSVLTCNSVCERHKPFLAVTSKHLCRSSSFLVLSKSHLFWSVHMVPLPFNRLWHYRKSRKFLHTSFTWSFSTSTHYILPAFRHLLCNRIMQLYFSCCTFNSLNKLLSCLFLCKSNTFCISSCLFILIPITCCFGFMPYLMASSFLLNSFSYLIIPPPCLTMPRWSFCSPTYLFYCPLSCLFHDIRLEPLERQYSCIFLYMIKNHDLKNKSDFL